MLGRSAEPEWRMRIQCPPCGARYSIAGKRIGPDGRALSKCAACGTWLVVHKLEDGVVRVQTTDDVGDRRSTVSLQPAEWADPPRVTLPIAGRLEEADSTRPTARSVPFPAIAGPMELAFDAPGAREDTDPDLGIRPLLGDDERAFDAPGAREITDPDARSPFAPTVSPAAPASTPAAPGHAGTPPAARDPAAAASLAEQPEELPSTAFFPSTDPISASAAVPPIPDLGALELELPDPRARRRSRTEVQAMLSEFSVMFRLDTRSRRRRTLWTALAVAAVCVGILGAVAVWGGRSLPALAEQTRELLVELSPPHALGVPWRVAGTSAAGGQPPGPARVRRISMLSQQLVQLSRVRKARRGTVAAPGTPISAPAARPGPAPARDLGSKGVPPAPAAR